MEYYNNRDIIDKISYWMRAYKTSLFAVHQRRRAAGDSARFRRVPLHEVACDVI